MTPAPQIHTDRLTLRGPERGDLAPLARMIQDPDRTRFTGGVGTAVEAERAMLNNIGHWQWHGYGYFTIVERSTGTAIGRCGVIFPASEAEPELSWHLFDAAHQGQGYALEATRAARQDAYDRCGLAPLVSYVAPENTASIRLAERLGATVEREETHQGHRELVFRHPEGRA